MEIKKNRSLLVKGWKVGVIKNDCYGYGISRETLKLEMFSKTVNILNATTFCILMVTSMVSKLQLNKDCI